MFRGLLGESSNVGITRRGKQEVGCWKDMFLLDRYGGAADRIGALEMVQVLTKSSAAKQRNYRG